jgi:hypothetical protein
VLRILDKAEPPANRRHEVNGALRCLGGEMAEVEKSPFENLIAGPSGWPEAYHQLQQLIGARGAILLLLLAAALFLVWNRKEINERLGIGTIVKHFKREAVPTARAGYLTIAIARLGNDKVEEHGKLLLDELGHFEGVETVAVRGTVDADRPDMKKAEEEARSLLGQTGADVLL